MNERDEELRAIAERYARRSGVDRYSLLRPEIWAMLVEREGALRRRLALRSGTAADWRLVEVGCGSGGNLLGMLRLGLRPEHLTGLELLPDRLESARYVLPAAVQLRAGDASQAEIAEGSQDLALQFTVFSSILNDDLQMRLAQAMWRWLKPGGAVLWYDFVVNNPRNADVRGVPLSRVRQLFPDGRMHAERVTLAPPVARTVCRVHPRAYALFNSVPWLRTHVLAVIEKP